MQTAYGSTPFFSYVHTCKRKEREKRKKKHTFMSSSWSFSVKYLAWGKFIFSFWGQDLQKWRKYQAKRRGQVSSESLTPSVFDRLDLWISSESDKVYDKLEFYKWSTTRIQDVSVICLPTRKTLNLVWQVTWINQTGRKRKALIASLMRNIFELLSLLVSPTVILIWFQ